MPKKSGKQKEKQMAIPKTIEEKIEKKQVLTKEEEIAILKDQDPVPGNKINPPSEEVIEEEVPKEEPKAEEKKEGIPATPKEEPSTIDVIKLETELAKPDGQEDLKNLSKREIAYFWQMRRDRRERQKAEEEADAARFELSKLKKEKPADKPAEVDPLEELKKKDPTDFLTVADVTKLLESERKKVPAPKEEPNRQQNKIPPIIVRHLEYCEKEARVNHPDDFDAVIELSDEILSNNSEYLIKVRKALQDGTNPAEVSYQLIKSDPDFAKLFPAAEIRAKAKAKKPEVKEKTPEELAKEKEAKEKEKALEENTNKQKTTGHATGGEGKSAEQYSAEEIAKMTDAQFRKLPKAQRQKYLELYG